MKSMRVAVIQAASVFVDKAASIQKTVDLIHEASKQDVDLILFPETMISGYPRGFTYGAYVGSRSQAGRDDYARFHTSSLAVTLADTKPLRDAAKAAGAMVVVGISEVGEAGNGGTLYNSMLYITAQGEIAGVHRKLMPTGTERLIWGSGDGSTLTTVDTDFGT
ncbi:MAG: nitrilase-related carbon-nitrogen hydrolase, partial [Aggregatilineales bacterium]